MFVRSSLETPCCVVVLEYGVIRYCYNSETAKWKMSKLERQESFPSHMILNYLHSFWIFVHTVQYFCRYLVYFLIHIYSFIGYWKQYPVTDICFSLIEIKIVIRIYNICVHQIYLGLYAENNRHH